MPRIFPTHADYDRSIVYFSQFVKVPQLAGGSPVLNKYNQPYSFNGGFAKVYRIKVQQKEYALRCWLAEQTSIGERYRLIEHFISTTHLPYFYNLNYYENGIIAYVNGKAEHLPVTIMEWIPFPTLGKFLKENLKKPEALIAAAESFVSMVTDLHKHKISHGCLCVNDIIVEEKAGKISLKLIDYDSLYFPALTKFTNMVGGVPGFQSPYRPVGYYNERMDYFSELVIYLSLLSFAHYPELCTFPDELMLFQEDDLRNPYRSPVFNVLLNSKVMKINKLAEVMHDYCNIKDIDRLLPLEIVIE